MYDRLEEDVGGQLAERVGKMVRVGFKTNIFSRILVSCSFFFMNAREKNMLEKRFVEVL